MTKDLIPCPICGKNPSIRRVRKIECCIECRGETYPKHHVYVLGLNQEQAVSEWNTRYCTVLDEVSNTPVCLPVIPTDDLIIELAKRKEVTVTTFRTGSMSDRMYRIRTGSAVYYLKRVLPVAIILFLVIQAGKLIFGLWW